MRFEDDVLAGLIDANSRVLDVGCGDGSLLLHLKKIKNVDGRGLEIDQKRVQESVAKGLAVIEGDAEKDLVDELLRVAKKAIITIPNFGYWKVRLNLLFQGTMPVTENLPHTWYNTPNLHMCTIKDFYNLCKLDNIEIVKSISISSDKVSDIQKSNLEVKNLISEIGIFLIKK
jgi:SAM-dependent methyltransferase